MALSKYSVLCRYSKPNGNGGTKWVNVYATGEFSAKALALAQVKISEPEYKWSTEKANKV